MRHPCTLGILSVLLANLAGGCIPYIPVEDAFTTSALKPTGNIPPEFAEFNNYDPEVNTLLADQLCATPYVPSLREIAPGFAWGADRRDRTLPTLCGQHP